MMELSLSWGFKSGRAVGSVSTGNSETPSREMFPVPQQGVGWGRRDGFPRCQRQRGPAEFPSLQAQRGGEERANPPRPLRW